MGRKRIKGTKYRKVSQQQKYIFLKCCISQGKNIQEAAFIAGIHYSTAKTILFFHKKDHKNYLHYKVVQKTPPSAKRASYSSLPINIESQTLIPKITIISSFDCSFQYFGKKSSFSRESTRSFKEQQLQSDIICQLGEDFAQNQENYFGKLGEANLERVRTRASR